MIVRRVIVITIPIVKTLLSDGLNSSGSEFLNNNATGGPPIAAIIPKMPDNVPAINELSLDLFIVQPKYDATPAKKTIPPTEIDKYFSLRRNNKYKPKGPPNNRPQINGFKETKSTLDFSLMKILIANGNPNSESNCGTRSGSTWTTIGEAITANPNPKTPWTADPINISEAIKNIWKSVRSKGKINQVLLLLT